ncbi:nucleoside-diphosphate-sugar epimerase [Arthrobacter pigmenti]|uniref:Nucleoside-diphosphate-sugar epimerase n=1 Tax=Arthrobacter pigmenti TaxID=271432 RepID=A0A846RQ35_9MICC|nr:NAD-dependent epimerase/dehydratase family protein [Arthrobacter pigmenti]NJC22504.1 nucleoside-diphosphate-sugar epimerase [Arthrobacter pigmenti]
MRILVLGGTVFLSRAVAAAALQAGHDVTCFARGTHGPPPPGARFVQGDRDGEDAYSDLREKWDAVVDVTSEPRHASEAATALGSDAGHWTFVSSCSVYADQGTPGQDESAAILSAYDGEGPAPREKYGEAKVACEQVYASALGGRALIIRPGLICGAGDGSDRFGYWPARLARGGTVIAPDIRNAATQTIDVRDLAAWIVRSAEAGLTGRFNALGPSVSFGDLLTRVAEITGFTGEFRWCAPSWLARQGVSYWAGPDSLPHWLPEGFEGFATRSAAAALRNGLILRSVDDTIREVLDDELDRGLDRERKSGLTPGTEQRLVGQTPVS